MSNICGSQELWWETTTLATAANVFLCFVVVVVVVEGTTDGSFSPRLPMISVQKYKKFSRLCPRCLCSIGAEKRVKARHHSGKQNFASILLLFKFFGLAVSSLLKNVDKHRIL